MEEITVLDARAKKEKLRITIIDLLTEFSKETGLFIEAVNIERTDNGFHRLMLIYQVEIDVRLP